VPIPVAGFSKT